MTKSLSILNIGSHPKDAIIYAGGTMAKHAARGDKVTMLTPTTGLSHHLQAIDEYRKSGDMPDMSALVEERKRELVDAANELGVPHGPRRSLALVPNDRPAQPRLDVGPRLP